MLYSRVQRWIMNFVVFLSSCKVGASIGTDETWGYVPVDPNQVDITGNERYEIIDPPLQKNVNYEKRGWEALDLHGKKRVIPNSRFDEMKRGWEGLLIKRGLNINKNSLGESKRGWEGLNLRYRWLKPRIYRPHRKRSEQNKKNDVKSGQHKVDNLCSCCNDMTSSCCSICMDKSSTVETNCLTAKTEMCCKICRSLTEKR